MRVLFIHNKYQYKGGEDTNLEMEIGVLENNGHHTQVILFDNNNITDTFSKIRTGISSFYNTSSASKVKEAIISFKPDIIHVHNLFFNASPAVLYAARSMNVPVVITLHNYRFICANALLLRNNKVCELCIQKTFPLQGIKYKCYRSSAIESALVTAVTGVHKMLGTLQNKTDAILVPSEFLKKRLVDSSLKLPPDFITVKPNFISDIEPGRTVREDFFLFVGRLSTEKGIKVLMDCFQKNPHLKLIIAGDGPEKETLQRIINNMPSIQYKGQLAKEEIMNLMKRCSALIFPSIWYEGLPLTIIEALACGTPVIASRLGAMPEMIGDKINGFTFNPNDAEDLERAIADFNDFDHIELQRNARMIYEKKYKEQVHYNSILDIYHKAIDDRRK